MKRLFGLLVFTAVFAIYAIARADCTVTTTVPCDGNLGYQIKDQGVLITVPGGALGVPDLNKVIPVVSPVTLTAKRVFLNATAPPVPVGFDFDVTHVGYAAQNILPSLGGQKFVLDAGDLGVITVKLGAGRYLIDNATLKIGQSAVKPALSQVYACWAPVRSTSLDGPRLTLKRIDRFGLAIVKADTVDAVCFPASAGNTPATGSILVCAKTPGPNTLGEFYTKNVNVADAFIQGLSGPQELEGIDDVCNSAVRL